MKPLHFATLPSTNAYAKTFLKGPPAPEPGLWHLITADHQTQGYGKEGRPWQAPPGNVAMSLACYAPGVALAHFHEVPLVCGLAVAQCLEDWGVDPRDIHLKWPNDVLVAEKKIAGILVEITLGAQHKTIETLVIGLGLNRGTAPDPAMVRFPPTALMEHVASPASVPTVQAMAHTLGEKILDALGELGTADHGAPSVIQRWEARAWRLGQTLGVTVPAREAPLEGLFMGLSPQGGLLLRSPGASHPQVVYSADIGGLGG